MIPRGTNYFFRFSLIPDWDIKWLKATNRNPVLPFAYGDKVFFGVKKLPSDTSYIIKRTCSITTDEETSSLSKSGKFGIALSKSETDMEPGIYYFSIAAKFKKDGSFYEIVPPSPFRIRKMMIKEADYP